MVFAGKDKNHDVKRVPELKKVVLLKSQKENKYQGVVVDTTLSGQPIAQDPVDLLNSLETTGFLPKKAGP